MATNSLEDATGSGAYVTSYQIYDSLLRPRQTQEPAEGSGTEVTDTFYDSQGDTITQNGPYAVSGSPSGKLWDTTRRRSPTRPPPATTAGRKTAFRMYSDGKLQSQTTWR